MKQTTYLATLPNPSPEGTEQPVARHGSAGWHLWQYKPFVLVVETERELYLAGGVGICRRVSAEACSIGDGAIGLLKVRGVEDVEGFDTEFQLARF